MTGNAKFIALPLSLLLASACEGRSDKSLVAESTFAKPSATEVFNLRTKCAALGQKIKEENSIGPALGQTQISHYNPKTNRCYVELDVFSAGDLTKPREINNIYLYDGQTGEMLSAATYDHGIKAGFGGVTLDASKPPYDAALETIGDYMADDRNR